MSLIPFPNIPNVIGVPPIPRSPLFPVAATVRAVVSIAQGMLWQASHVDTQWGIWDAFGTPLADPAKFTGFGGFALDALGLGSRLSTDGVCYSKETRVCDFPVERGGFASYNKVELPAEPAVTLALSGSEDDRATFLNAIDEACKSTALYSVVTPEVVYIDYTVESYDYERRNSKGATLLIVTLNLKEIRQVSAQYSESSGGQIDQPKAAGASPQVDSGKAQPKAPQQSSLKSIANKLGI